MSVINTFCYTIIEWLKHGLEECTADSGRNGHAWRKQKRLKIKKSLYKMRNEKTFERLMDCEWEKLGLDLVLLLT